MNRGRIEQIGTSEEVYEHPSARLELEREDDAGIIEAEIPSDLYRSPALCEGETLLVRARKTEVFPNAA